MGKPFEIHYSPADWDAPPGGIATQWSVPYGGLNVQAPENLIGPSYSPAMNNVFFRNSELRSRPKFSVYLPGPDGQNPILGVNSFLSKNLFWHTVAFTVNGMYQLTLNAQSYVQRNLSPWSRLGGPLLSSNNPVAIRTFQNIVYYTNGSGHLSAWDGSNPTPLTDVAFTGTTWPLPNNYTGTTFSSLFLGELDSHILMGYTSETAYTNGVATGATAFPQRIRWSNIGFNPILNTFGGNLGTAGATFDPSVNLNAGSADMLDVTDVITGMMFLGRMGYIFRQQGITEIDPTGSGTAPFDFNHLWASEHGIGNVFPLTIDQYGSYGMFVATNNVYQVTPGNVTPVGAGTRDAIMLDLSFATSAPVAAIIPSLAVYRIYLTYSLFIPQATGTRVYVYSFDDNNWATWFMTGVTIGKPTGCWIGDPIISTTSPVLMR